MDLSGHIESALDRPIEFVLDHTVDRAWAASTDSLFGKFRFELIRLVVIYVPIIFAFLVPVASPILGLGAFPGFIFVVVAVSIMRRHPSFDIPGLISIFVLFGIYLTSVGAFGWAVGLVLTIVAMFGWMVIIYFRTLPDRLAEIEREKERIWRRFPW